MTGEGASESMIRFEVDGPIAWARFDRAEKLNAMPRSFWGELAGVVDAAEANDDVRALIIAGNGKCFSVGGDIADFGNLGDAGDKRAYLSEALAAFRRLAECVRPTIAAVHGHAQGGGCELTMVCDIVVADETAKFATPESRVGLVPGLGVARGLDQLNQHWLRYMIMTGEALDAEEARLAGLVNKVVPAGQHEAEAEQLAKRIAERAPLAMKVAKSVLGRHTGEGYGHGVDANAYLQSTEDFNEAIAAFEERREPQFKGR